MTAPRDPIEALRDALGCGSSVNHTLWHERMTLLDEVLAAARDEGRREAVDTIRSRVLTTPCYRPGCICEDGPVARHTLHRILDDVARHGRPSDPEPAHTEGQGEVCDPDCPHWSWRERENERRAVPLQATGEPPSDRITITPDIEGDARRNSESLNDMLRGAGATGEGERHE